MFRFLTTVLVAASAASAQVAAAFPLLTCLSLSG